MEQYGAMRWPWLVAEAGGGALGAQSLSAFVGALASDRPTPGGGAAAALALAMGRALLAMAAAVTGRRASGPEAAWLAAVVASEGPAATASIALAERDAQAFAAIAGALSLPRADEAERAARRAALAEAARDAAAEGEAAARLCLEALRQAAALEPRVRPSIQGDVRAGRTLAAAALAITLDNLEVNAALLPDSAATALRTRVADLRAQAAGLTHAAGGDDERA